MANDLLDKLPDWLKSLYHMENELRSSARNGLILRKDEASEHLAQARRHVETVLNEAKGVEPPNGPQTPLRKEGEVGEDDFATWLGWAFVHLLKLMGVENRIKVFVTWAWHYVTWNSDGRIITAAPPAGPEPPPAPKEPAPKTA